jgi:hypothetical protein
MDKRMRRKCQIELLILVVLCPLALVIGYFEAWHLSLSRQYSATELVVDLGTRNLQRLRGTGQLDTATEKETSAMILAQLGFLMAIQDLQKKSIFWALENPRAFLLISKQVARPKTVEELLVRARDSGVDVSTLREFPGFPADLR